jgi:hypothetical protein
MPMLTGLSAGAAVSCLSVFLHATASAAASKQIKIFFIILVSS